MERSRRIESVGFLVFLWFLIVAAALVLAWVIYGAVVYYCYRFPFVTNWKWLLTISITHLFPVVLISAAVFFLIRNKQKFTVVCLIVFVPVIIHCFFAGASYGLYKHSIISYTTDPSHFGIYDARPDESLKLNPPEVFPDAIPGEAHNVQYCYYYQNASAETLYIAVAWETDMQFLEQMAEQMEQSMLVESNGSQIIYRANYRIASNITKITKNLVIIDYEKNQICYVVTNNEDLLPETINDVFIDSFTDKAEN